MNRLWLVGGAGVALAALAILHPLPGPAPSAVVETAGRAPAKPLRHARPVSEEIVVYVVGAVGRRGLYRLRVGARAADAVAAAGGLAPDADAAGINLAARLADGDEVLVPAAGQSAPPRRVRRSRRAAATPAPASIDVNAAAAPELARVPGIGRAIALRIVEMRERDGAFASLDELLDVSGMTQARLERARPFLQPM